MGAEAGEQLLASDVAADPPTGTEEEELTKALSSGAWPGAGDPATEGDDERPEQIDSYDPRSWRALAPLSGGSHDPHSRMDQAATPREQAFVTLSLEATLRPKRSEMTTRLKMPGCRRAGIQTSEYRGLWVEIQAPRKKCHHPPNLGRPRHLLRLTTRKRETSWA